MKKSVDYITVESDIDDGYKDNYNDDNFPAMLMKLFSRVNIKIAIFIFILGLFTFSDIYVRNILSTFNGAVNQLGCPTSHGTIIQLSFLVIGYILIDLLVQGSYI
jgi:hypothetical protein